MGRKIRGTGSLEAIQGLDDSARPVFTNNKAGNVEFTGYVMTKIEPKVSILLSSGWVWHHNGVHWSWMQYFKYQLRKLLRLPVEANDPRDLMTWRRSSINHTLDE